MNAIETKALVKKYGDKTAVNGLNLTVEEGEIFALLGVNGAGKTTTIKMLTGLSQPTSGDAFLAGNSILSDAPAVKQVTSVSPQETAVAGNLTVRENLEFMAAAYGAGKVERKKKAQEIIVSFHMQEVENSRARTLSGGWQRRLSIAMALISGPKILFLDEPTLGLDVLARRELWQAVEKLRGTTTVVLTTHYLEEAEKLADHIGIMARGELKARGTAEELKQLTGCQSFEDAFVLLAQEEAV